MRPGLSITRYLTVVLLYPERWRSACSSSRGPGLDFLHPHGCSQLCVAPVPQGIWCHLDCGHQSHTWCTGLCVCKTPIRFKINLGVPLLFEPQRCFLSHATMATITDSTILAPAGPLLWLIYMEAYIELLTVININGNFGVASLLSTIIYYI